MAPKHRMTTKGAPKALANGKRTRNGEPKATETAIVPSRAVATPTRQQEGDGGGGRGSAQDGEAAIVPLQRGGGRGLKAVQKSQEFEMEQNKVDGTNLQRKSKIKEQKLYTAKGNQHVETKVMTEDKRRKTSKDGTITITSTTTVKKVCYT